MGAFPTVCKSVVYHVGREPGHPPSTRPDFSYEGSGLSVSEFPDEWRAIAQLPGETWELVPIGRESGCFVDVYAAGTHALEQAVREGLIEPAVLWSASYEEEVDWDVYEERQSLHATKADLIERWGDEEDLEERGIEVEEMEGWAPSPALAVAWGEAFSGPLDPTLVEDFAILTSLERSGQYDGAWWDDELDPVGLSAPRGVIFQSMLGGWSWSREAL